MGNEDLVVQISGIWYLMLIAASDRRRGADTQAGYHSCNPPCLKRLPGDFKGQSLRFVLLPPPHFPLLGAGSKTFRSNYIWGEGI